MEIIEKHMEQVHEEDCQEILAEDSEGDKAIEKLIVSLNVQCVRSRFMGKNVNIDGLCSALKEMKSMIGIGRVKESILANVCYLLSCKLDATCLSPEKLHTVFMGEPGTGKTTMSIIFAKILMSIGFGESPENPRSLKEKISEAVDILRTEYPSSCEKGVEVLSELVRTVERRNIPSEVLEDESFVVASRINFVAGYQGQTAQRTEDFLFRHDGKIIIIDESYALCYGAEDNYGREALDVIMSQMSSKENRSIFFFNGYNDEIVNNLFGSQRGMERRIHNVFFFDPYSPSTLEKIFIRKASKMGLVIDEKVKESFSSVISLFNVKANGGDMEKLSLRCKILMVSATFADIVGMHPEADMPEERVISPEIFTRAFNELFPKRESSMVRSFSRSSG